MATTRPLEVLADAAYLQVHSWLKPQLELVWKAFQISKRFIIVIYLWENCSKSNLTSDLKSETPITNSSSTYYFYPSYASHLMSTRTRVFSASDRICPNKVQLVQLHQTNRSTMERQWNDAQENDHNGQPHDADFLMTMSPATQSKI